MYKQILKQSDSIVLLNSFYNLYILKKCIPVDICNDYL